MKVTFFQQFSTLFMKHLINYLKNKTYIKQIVAIAVVSIICILLNDSGSGNAFSNICVYMPLAIMLFVRGSVLTWVQQRENKHVEVQKIMGASSASYLFSWMTFFICNGLILSTLFILVLVIAGVFSTLSSQQTLKILILYYLLMLSVFFFSMMLSCFFNHSQLAAQITSFMQILGVGLFYLLQIQSLRNSSIAITIISLLPSVCFQMTSLMINTNSNPYKSLPFSEFQGYTMLVSQVIIYFVLFVYFQFVIPLQNGTHQHPLFFLKYFLNKNIPKQQIQQKLNHQEPLSTARFLQKENQEQQISCRIKNLNKSFGNKKVVNNLTLNLHKKQIFCLLGHNGAGKSTTINMLTGILKPDHGQINICGYDHNIQMNKIRQKVGVCLQTNVLYDKLTVKQHLQFFGKLKGYYDVQLDLKVSQILKKCCLQSQVDKQSAILSGGNKRKLCLACASIGNSEVIFLDEPSSGMDPNTRRNIWGMIEQLKQQGKTIVLTTHHLQQAQALSDRIGILASGELVILGSRNYIKQKFSVGYNLKINLQNYPALQVDSKKAWIRQTITKFVEDLKQDEQVAKNQMKFYLPNSSEHQSTYPMLFKIFEQNEIQFSLISSSLQDIFIRIDQNPQQVDSNAGIPQIQKIQLPNHISSYSFLLQLSAVFHRKRWVFFRSITFLFYFIIPTLYISIGVIIGLLIQTPSGEGIDHFQGIWGKFNILGNFMTIAYAFNISTFCGGLVAQRQIKFKYISFVMGMRKIPYWLGTFLFDMLLFWVPFILVCIIIVCFPYSYSSIYIDKLGYLMLMFFCFSCSFLPFTYLWSHAFQSAQTAYRFYPFLVLIVFTILPQVPIYTQPRNDVLKILLSIVSPLLTLLNGILSKQMIGTDVYDYFIDNNVDIYTTSSIWISVGILLIQGCVYMTLAVFLDNAKFRLNDRQNLENQEMQSQRSQDLIKQQKKIKESGEKAPIVVDNLYKKFPDGFIAIKDNSFLVQQGETFGLLGPNGAGKSTTFNILTAALPKTHGTVKLLNHQVNRSEMKIFNQVGICPQFNPVYDNLTIYEHLTYFSQLKGLNKNEMKSIIQFYIKNLQLGEYKHQRVGTLSGGNKRKLCVCIALIGNPTLLFLDQPSAGVDAISRRYLWNMLSTSSKQSKKSVVLTTHSIHQAESLCNRIGILIKGQFICIGTPTQLKNRYGKGYRINVKCQNEKNIQKVHEQMNKHFKQFQVHQNKEEFKISYLIQKKNFSFSLAFNLFNNQLYKNRIIKQYQISENSLQDVFIQLSKMQPQPQCQYFKPSSRFCCWQKSQKGCLCLF